MSILQWYCWPPNVEETPFADPAIGAYSGFVGTWTSIHAISATIDYAGDESMDVFGNSEPIELSTPGELGPYTPIYIVGPVRLSPEDGATISAPGCGAVFACTMIMERGSPSHRVQLREAYFDGNNNPLETLPFEMDLGNDRRTAVLQVSYNKMNEFGDPVHNLPDHPTYQLLNAKCLVNRGGTCPNGLAYHEAFNYLQLVPDSAFGYNITDSEHAPFIDKGLGYRQVYHNALNVAADNLPYLEPLNNTSCPEFYVPDHYFTDKVWNCGLSPVVNNPHLEVRFIGRKTGVTVSHCQVVIRRAFATARLGLLYLFDSETDDEKYYVLSEVNITAYVGIRRSAHAVDYWSPAGYEDENGDPLQIPVDFGADLCNTTATVTRPDGRVFTEQLICQVRLPGEGEADWRAIPPVVQWNGISAPEPWGYPGVANRIGAIPDFGGGDSGQCCDSLYAVHGASVPAEPTYTYDPGNAARQEYRGAVVLSLPDLSNAACVPA